ncbi:unnamed protein product [Lymnaea stagnalis]|uniref:Sushi, von Willebrand factor type A, EGF and pentraxin domain-containing protein 1-like n=1 Tax=Lymnaea stagnalis TaxID=6523 RepID=A0AAV2HR80_LYMST
MHVLTYLSVMALLSWGTRLGGVESTQNSYNETSIKQRGCQLLPSINANTCLSAGSAVSNTASESSYVQEGTVCAMDSNTSTPDLVTCRRGRWENTGFEEISHNAGQRVSRVKRAVISSELPITDFGWSGRPDSPPKITCPIIGDTHYADKGKITAKISWEKAKAYDEEDGVIQVTKIQGQEQGSDHSFGNHVVGYVAFDSVGQSALCSVNFTVIVLRCPYELTYLYHGVVACDQVDNSNIYGSKCSYTCDVGFELVGAPGAECLKNETWSNLKPSCKAVSCGAPSSLEHGILVCSSLEYSYGSMCLVSCQMGYAVSGEEKITCQANKAWTSPGQCLTQSCTPVYIPENSVVSCSDGTLFGSVCSMKCSDTFELQGDSLVTCQGNNTWSSNNTICIPNCPTPLSPSHSRYICDNGQRRDAICNLQCDPGFEPQLPISITCNSDMTWSKSGSCLDKMAPVFPKGCTDDMELHATGLGRPTLVNYTMPPVEDNSGDSVTSSGVPAPFSAFPVGQTVVTITATDSSGNNATCQFNVSVQYYLCKNPNDVNSQGKNIHYNCSDGFMVGAVCVATCINGSAVKGATSVTCEWVVGSDVAQWTWSGSFGPYCQDLCHPGQNSSNGKQPCQPCLKGTYQSNFGNSSCDICPYGMSTVIRGAETEDACEPFDLPIILNMSYPFIAMYEFKPSSLTMLTWIYVRSQVPNTILKFSLRSIIGSAFLSLDAVGVYILPVETTDKTPIRKWYHVALTFLNENVTLYVNGEPKDNVKGLWVSDLWKKTFILKFEGNAINFITNKIVLGGVQLTPKYLLEADVREFITTCKKKMEDNVLVALVIEPTMEKPSTCDVVDDCVGDPCGQHGVCFDEPGRARCVCDAYWSGERCDFQPNYCNGHLCANGATCVSNAGFMNYTCVCADGYSGVFCNQTVVYGNWSSWGLWSTCSVSCGLGQRSRQRQCNRPRSDGVNCLGLNVDYQRCYGYKCPVDGGYGGWSEWSKCSVTCGGGVATRRRVCDSPVVSMSGADCDASLATGSMQCNTGPCPACRVLSTRAGHASLTCSDNPEGTVKTCNIQCRPGLTIMPDTVNIFRCGLLSSYRWSHQTDQNPEAFLPDCSETKRPSKVTLRLTFQYDNVSKSMAGELIERITANVNQQLDCIKTNSCAFNVTLTCTSCKYSENTTDVLGGISSPIVGTITVETNANLIPVVPQYLSKLSDTERQLEILRAETILQLVNDTRVILSFSIGQEQHIGRALAAIITAICQDGAGLVNGFCVDCPAGSYLALNGSCVLCSPGTYQNQTQMTSCVPCPKCKTNLGYGAYLLTHCTNDSQPACNASPPGPTGENYTALIIGVVCGASGLIIIVTLASIIFRRQIKRHPFKLSPYDIPGSANGTCEDDYETLPQANDYDVIADNPYPGDNGLKEMVEYSKSVDDTSAGNEISAGSMSYIDVIDEPTSGDSADLGRNDESEKRDDTQATDDLQNTLYKLYDNKSFLTEGISGEDEMDIEVKNKENVEDPPSVAESLNDVGDGVCDGRRSLPPLPPIPHGRHALVGSDGASVRHTTYTPANDYITPV